jgi:chromosome segregation ATPase
MAGIVTEAPNGDARIRELEQEVNLLNQRVTQREQALIQLNRRLRQLETGQQSSTELQSQLSATERALEELEATKTFRYTARLRDIYRRVLQVRRG